MYFGGSKASVFKKLQGINYLNSSTGNTYANEKLAGTEWILQRKYYRFFLI